MNRLKFLKDKSIQPGYLYFYIHFIVEIVCFYYLSMVTKGSLVVWILPFLYDAFAFVPQGIIGYINDKIPKLRVDMMGVILLLLSYAIYLFTPLSVFVSLFILCIGNCSLHVSGAILTLKTSNGKLSSPAIFVAGGSFGVISGRLLSRYNFSPYLMFIFIITMIPFIILSRSYDNYKIKEVKYDYANKNINPIIVVLVATLIVIVRGYMGYGIPTSWNKTVFQTVLLFCFMGIGKAFGGILSDIFGIRKIGLLSTLLAIPFLAFGDHVMIISLFGVMLFSMTMSITLALIVSVLKRNPGLGFGFTTFGLFLGTAPIFFVNIPSTITNIIMIFILSLLCFLSLSVIIKKENR